MSISECLFGGVGGVPFGPPFSALAGRFLKKRNVSRYYKYRHLRAFGRSKRSFFERVKSCDFDIENGLKRYVYSGFSDFPFSSKSVLRSNKRHFLVQCCVRPKIAQTLRIECFERFGGFEKHRCSHVREIPILDMFWILAAKMCSECVHVCHLGPPPKKSTSEKWSKTRDPKVSKKVVGVLLGHDRGDQTWLKTLTHL